MDIAVHILVFVASSLLVWFCAGLLIDSVARIAKRIGMVGFTAAFFILGILTSLSEISVALNASIKQVPQVSLGNLVGASIVILLLIVPLLAFLGNGLRLSKVVPRATLLVALLVIAMPALFALNGSVTRVEGAIALVAYACLVLIIRASARPASRPKNVTGRTMLLADFVKIVLGAGAIFFAGNSLVGEAVYFSEALSIPASVVGLLLLSVGTNLPEIVIAIRAIAKGHSDIAFGDYLGSAATNTLIFGVLVVAGGGFTVVPAMFLITALIMMGGFGCFFIFAFSKGKLSRFEGAILLCFYAAFIITALGTVSVQGS